MGEQTAPISTSVSRVFGSIVLFLDSEWICPFYKKVYSGDTAAVGDTAGATGGDAGAARSLP
jgi:hypothetical protein